MSSPRPRRSGFRLTPARIALIYAGVAAAWILLSDTFLGFLTGVPGDITRVQTVKGLAFVAVTAWLLYELTRRSMAALATAQQERREVEARRSAASHALEESQRTLSTLMSNLPGMVYRCRNDRDWTMEFVSEGSRALTGYAPSELVGNRRIAYGDLVHRDDRQRVWDEVQEAVAARRPFRIVYRIETETGEERWVSERGVAVAPIDDEPVRLEGFITDISEWKRAEEASKLLAAAVQQTAEGICITDAEGTIQYVNPGFERITGYTSEEVVGENPRILKSGVHGDAYYREMWDALTRGQVWSSRIINRRKDGTLYEEDQTISPVRDASGVTVNYVAVKRDVSREVALERQLAQSRRLEAVGKLAGGIAHDFNNLLMAIMGHCDLLLADLAEDGQVHGDVVEIRKSAERASSLTRQLLAFSRRQIMQPRLLDLNQVVTDMDAMLSRLVREDVELVTHLREDLGTVKADPVQIEQVVLNLVVNARDAMPEGGKIVIETANVDLDRGYAADHVGVSPGPYVMLAVSDTGTGIDPEVRDTIFEPFVTTKGQERGTGLGLSTVYGIVKQSGGNVWAYSEPGEGTTFKVYLPRVEEQVQREPAEPPPPAESLEASRGDETVLLVEDDPAVRRVIGLILRRHGYSVMQVESPEDALELCRSGGEGIELLITDVVMPGLNGPELAERVAELRPDLKVLYLSGHAERAIAERGLVDPGVPFLQKPFRHEDLVRKVRALLDGPGDGRD